MKKIRFGVVGLGNQGTHYTLDLFAKGVIENGYITVVPLQFDMTAYKALEFCKQYEEEISRV